MDFNSSIIVFFVNFVDAHECSLAISSLEYDMLLLKHKRFRPLLIIYIFVLSLCA